MLPWRAGFVFAAVSLLLSAALLRAQENTSAKKSARHHCGEAGVKFIPQISANGPAAGGETMLGYTAYHGSDGSAVSTTFGEFHSAKEATEELENSLTSLQKDGATVVGREPKRDGEGNDVGNRVELSRDGKDGAPRNFVVLWTSGARFHEVASNCHADLLKVEKMLPQ
jgi:hypothetical protein